MLVRNHLRELMVARSPNVVNARRRRDGSMESLFRRRAGMADKIAHRKLALRQHRKEAN